MFILTSKSSTFPCFFISLLKSVILTAYNKRIQDVLAFYMVLFAFPFKPFNHLTYTCFNFINSYSRKSVSWKTPARAISFTSRPGSQILFKIRNERVVNITGSNSLSGKMVCLSDITEEYLTFVRNERYQLVLIPILELKISFSHPQYQHLSY